MLAMDVNDKAGIRTARVNVYDHREHARSYRDRYSFILIARPALMTGHD